MTTKKQSNKCESDDTLTFDSQGEIIKTNESTILDYFQRVKSGDLQGLLNLFYDDSVIYEPFSKLKCVTGKSEIKEFLRTVLLANTGMQQEINFVRRQGQKVNINDNRVVTLVKFHKGEFITGKFTFEFGPPDQSNRKRIKTLNIEFID